MTTATRSGYGRGPEDEGRYFLVDQDWLRDWGLSLVLAPRPRSARGNDRSIAKAGAAVLTHIREEMTPEDARRIVREVDIEHAEVDVTPLVCTGTWCEDFAILASELEPVVATVFFALTERAGYNAAWWL